ncbi:MULTISPECIES: polyheme membrane-associated cytochrome C [Falsihalocynthiibacter]|uniref:polyheme membrane-associated cytochrome C n=1 Tax=Falsihalocynthiibacter TaxID=2854182 RepID=UPI0030028788
MVFRIFWKVSLCLGLALGASLSISASAQNAPTNEEILEAWLSSPHADSTREAFRHWDTEGEIPGTCAVCHSSTGIIDYLAAPQTMPGLIDHPVPIGTTVECSACHNDGAKGLSEVLFPNGTTVSTPNSSAICSVCHQGRSSSEQVEASVAEMGEDIVSAEIKFINIHYAAAASTQLGNTARGGYQYEGRNYVGPFAHVETLGTCVSCHNPHDTRVKLESCTTCHQGAADFRAIRTTPLDILGDGNTTAGIGNVISQLHDQLNAAIMTYSQDIGGGAIVYSGAAYPYFFNDLNADGIADPTETVFPNAYKSWTPRLLKAAYNYQFVSKDKGAFAHNAHYVIQLMIDSIESLSEVATVDATGFTRP